MYRVLHGGHGQVTPEEVVLSSSNVVGPRVVKFSEVILLPERRGQVIVVQV